MSGTVSLGLAAAVGPETAAQVARAAEQAGFHALWINDTPDADALSALAAAAAVTDRLVLATGVLPLDRRTAEEIVDAVGALALPQERLVLGIGSGQAGRGALALVRAATAHLRGALDARVVVGALGPKMRRIGAIDADGVLLNWLTPEIAAVQTAEAHDVAEQERGARDSGSPAPVALYVRTAIDTEARGRLERESARYGGFGAYAANFARLGIAASDTVISPDDDLAAKISAYRDAVDEVVLRAIVPTDEPGDLLAFVARVGSLLAQGQSA